MCPHKLVTSRNYADRIFGTTVSDCFLGVNKSFTFQFFLVLFLWWAWPLRIQLRPIFIHLWFRRNPIYSNASSKKSGKANERSDAHSKSVVLYLAVCFPQPLTFSVLCSFSEMQYRVPINMTVLSADGHGTLQSPEKHSTFVTFTSSKRIS